LKPATVDLLMMSTTDAYVLPPPPDTTPFPIFQTSVSVGSTAHAVVSMEAPTLTIVKIVCEGPIGLGLGKPPPLAVSMAVPPKSNVTLQGGAPRYRRD
jgi:hypothetical protein